MFFFYLYMFLSSILLISGVSATIFFLTLADPASWTVHCTADIEDGGTLCCEHRRQISSLWSDWFIVQSHFSPHQHPLLDCTCSCSLPQNDCFIMNTPSTMVRCGEGRSDPSSFMTVHAFNCKKEHSCTPFCEWLNAASPKINCFN